MLLCIFGNESKNRLVCMLCCVEWQTKIGTQEGPRKVTQLFRQYGSSFNNIKLGALPCLWRNVLYRMIPVYYIWFIQSLMFYLYNEQQIKNIKLVGCLVLIKKILFYKSDKIIIFTI